MAHWVASTAVNDGVIPSLPTHQAGDKIVGTVSGKPDTVGDGVLSGGFVLTKKITGGLNPQGTDTGATYIQVFELLCTSGSHPTPTVVSGFAGSNNATFQFHTIRLDAGESWADTIAGSADHVQGGIDNTAGVSLNITTGSYTNPPAAGDVLILVGCVPSDVGSALGSFSASGTGLSGGTQHGSVFSDSSLGQDSGQSAHIWEGFTGVLSGGISFSHTITGYSSATGCGAAIAIRVLNAPGVPTNVSGDAALSTADLTWDPPVSGGAVTSYQGRVNGGSPVTITDPHTFTGLSAGTTYTLGVRAVGPGGTSAWVEVEVTTADPGMWTCLITVGGHSFTVDEGDEADPDVPNVLAGLSVGWRAPTRSQWDWSGLAAPSGPFTFQPGTTIEGGWPAQPDPWIAKLNLLTDTAAELSDLEVGDKVWIRFYPDGVGGDLMVEFAGRIRDVTGAPVPRQNPANPARHVTKIVAADYTMDLLEIDFAPDEDWEGWPSGSPDNTPAARWEQAADYLVIPSLDDTGYPVPLSTATMIGGPGPGTAYTVLRSIMQATHAMLTAQWDTDTGDLDPDHPWVGKLWRPNMADGLVRQFLYGGGLTLEDGDISSGGVPAAQVPIERLQWVRDTISPGFDTSGPYGIPLEGAWTANGLRYVGQDAAVVSGWFLLPEAMSTLVGISGIATARNPRGVSWHTGRLSSATLTVGPRAEWVVDFTLIRTVPDAVVEAADSITWDELPSDLTWDDVNEDVTWSDMASVTEAT